VLLSLLPTPPTKQTPILIYVFYVVGVHPSSSPNISVLVPVKKMHASIIIKLLSISGGMAFKRSGSFRLETL
jgi:hypothetical protein